MPRILLSAALIALCTIALGQPLSAHEIKAGALIIAHPWAKAPPPSAPVMGGFMKITNTGQQDDRLLSASSEIATVVQIHNMKMEGDMMKMEELPNGIAIKAGETITFKPGALHIMFMKLKSVPEPGSTFAGQLVFEKAGVVDISYEVEDADEPSHP